MSRWYWFVMLLLVVSNGFLSWRMHRGEANYASMKAAADLCISTLERMAQQPAFYGSREHMPGLAQSWGLPQTCLVGELRQDFNHADVVYACDSPNHWKAFPVKDVLTQQAP